MTTAYQQLAINQGLGTVIAALINLRRHDRASHISNPGQYRTAKYGYKGYPVAMTTRLQENYYYEAEVTQHPVENGSPLSDHVILRPLRIELAFEVGNADGLGEKATLAKQALDTAVKVWSTRQFFDLVTTHRYLRNMVCLSLRPENQSPEWGALKFRATFQQVTLVDLQTVKYAPDNVLGASAVSSSAESDSSNAFTHPGGPPNGRSAQAATPAHQAGINSVLGSGIFDRSVIGVNY